ncbi:hypothetical protein [Cognaticolwellia beringensis]|uniref:Co-chaperone DjlA N-terminal domain-containing protein n=1 Tax=Cognaticolwellia beringensis TaxID=1967665 RepID=A0A222G5M6_9GAMM|nr:hypothetical protein [Cognaticolwellia beringensis]ASP47206.1 hypothetical protein B5D82_05195 [Cognaticolwellia beringensis]
MKTETLDVIVKIAACVCGKDGIISQMEEESIYNTITSKSSNYTLEFFNKAIDDFFDENLQLEDYLEKVKILGIHEFVIYLCEVSASADGLDIKENIALNKVKLILGDKL